MASRTLARRALFPLTERRFTHESYARFLDRLVGGERYRVVPLREFRETPPGDGVVVGLRHDVDVSLRSACVLARLEHERGLRSSYFVLHTAGYWRSGSLVPALRTLQDELGHEIGWHNDLVTLECVHGGDAKRFLGDELARLRACGIRIGGVVSHGSIHCGALGYHNDYFFVHCEREIPSYPNTRVVTTARGPRPVPKASLADFNLDYDGSYLGEDAFFHDSFFHPNGRRWHVDELDLDSLPAGTKAIVLVHPCHWDASAPAKVARLARLAGGRLLGKRAV